MTTDTTPALEALASLIRAHGAIPTIRVSSAQARGAAKRYSYWGAVRYEIRLTRDGRPSNCALERASSDRRSERLAARDAETIADREDRLDLQWIGTLDERAAADILARLAQ